MQVMSGIIILLCAAISIVAFFHRMRISPLIGYFVAGALIGPYGLELVYSNSMIDILGEIGIIFLLFLIGLELTLERLMAMRRHVFGLGGIQVVITTLSITTLSYYYGINLKSSIIIGGGLALSSTAIVLKVLQEKNAVSNQVGRLSVAILLLQDFAVVPLLVLVPLFIPDAQEGLLEPIIQALTKAFFALIIIFTVGRLLIRPLFNLVTSTKNDEVFIATTLLIALGTAYITNYFNLSMALGAFVAGLIVAETEYCHEVEQVILPFKKLLLGLFFMAIGMSIDLAILYQNLFTIILLATSLMMLKAIIILTVCLLFKCKKSSAIKVSFLLSQGGEFAFILFSLDATEQIIAPEILQMLMAIVTVTMSLTPFFAKVGDYIAKKMDDEEYRRTIEQILDYDTMDMTQHVIIAGFGKIGKVVAKVLELEQVNYIGMDVDSNIVNKEQDAGFSVFMGDITKVRLLKAMRAERAQSIVLATGNPLINRKAIKVIKDNFPEVNIIVRVKDLSDAASYYELGANYLVPETCEAGLQLGANVLSNAGFSESAVVSVKSRFRFNNYDKPKNIKA